MIKKLAVVTKRRLSDGSTVEEPNPRVKKLDLERFRVGTDRVFVHEQLGIHFRCRIQVTKQQAMCPACRTDLVRVGDPVLYPVRVSVVECDESGDPTRTTDGALKVLATFNHNICPSADGVASSEHFSIVKGHMRDLVFAALEAKGNLQEVLAENVVESLDPPDLRSETEKRLEINLQEVLDRLAASQSIIDRLAEHKQLLHQQMERNIAALNEAEGTISGLLAELALAKANTQRGEKPH